jgi:hypothetical protein
VGTEILVPTWATWKLFDDEFDNWKQRRDASGIASVGPFFSGGEILPDGSTVLEDYEFERIEVDYDNDTSTVTILNEGKIPRSRLDMKKLYEFDPRTEDRSDIDGTKARRTKFYKDFISDIERAKKRDPDKTIWINTFKRVKPQLEGRD